ncbi:MAG: hypothetical protein ACI9WU_004695 [Myxococcota bacterium]
MTAWRAPIAVGVALLALPLLIGAAIPFEASIPEPSPLYLVRAMDSAAHAGDWEAAHGLFDYRAKSRSMLPDLWDPASESEREDMVMFLQPLFQTTWEKAWGSETFKAGIQETTVLLAPDRALVEQTGFSADGMEHTFRYWLTHHEDGWHLVDRTRRKDGVHHESSGLVGVIRKRIQGELGREPTLREFVINAPSWLDRVRVRTIRAGDLMGR